MKRSIIICLFLLSLSLAHIGCNTKIEAVKNGIEDIIFHGINSNNISMSTIIPELEGHYSRGIGFVRDEDRQIHPLNRPQTEEFRIPEDESFSPFLIIGNGEEVEKTFIVTTILDYKQVQFELDGIMGLLHEVIIPPKTEIEFPFSLDIEETGAHDIQVIAFDYPYSQRLDDDFRMNLYGHIVARRTMVVVGNNDIPVRNLQPFIYGVNITQEIKFDPYVNFASIDGKEEKHASQRQLYVDQAQSGKPYQCQLLLNSRKMGPVVYALIPFLDYHQVQVNGSDLLLAYFESEQETIIDLELQLPEETGLHNFQMIWLVDPYKSVLRNEVNRPFVDGSARIAIEIK